MNASEQFKNVGTKCGLITLGGRTLSEHDNSDYEDENIVGLLYKPPFKANDFSCPAFSKPSVKSLAGHGVIKEEHRSQLCLYSGGLQHCLTAGTRNPRRNW